MNAVPYYSNNFSMLAWVIIGEAVDIIRRKRAGDGNKLFLTRGRDDLVSKICYLSPECFLKNDNWRIRTEGEYIILLCQYY
jgi:hypothetical protein